MAKNKAARPFINHGVYLRCVYLSFVGFMYAVGEESPEVRTAGGHDGPMYGEMAVLDTNHRVTQLTVLAQVV